MKTHWNNMKLSHCSLKTLQNVVIVAVQFCRSSSHLFLSQFVVFLL